MSSPDNLYLNITINNPLYGNSNPGSGNKKAIYDETLTVPVLQHPSDYYVSVVRFSLPSDQIPFFSFPVNPHQTNPNIGPYSIGVRLISGVQYIEPVVYVPSNNLPVPTPAGSDPYFNYNDIISPYYFIYHVQPFLTMINTALSTAVTNSGLGVTAPYYVFIPETQLISLIVTQAFIATGARIYVNEALKPFLDSFPFTTMNTLGVGAYAYYHDLTALPYGSPPTGPYQFTQEYNTLDLWFDINKIVLLSNSIPVIQEASPVASAGVVNSDTNTNGTANSLPILTDYAITYNNIDDASSVITYVPTAQYRIADMSSKQPLNRINLSFYWQSKNGTLYPIYISPGNSVSVKLGFFKKSTYGKRF